LRSAPCLPTTLAGTRRYVVPEPGSSRRAGASKRVTNAPPSPQQQHRRSPGQRFQKNARAGYARILAATDSAHWRIETTSHYTRDVTFAEDRSRIRTNPGVFARIRSFGFNILKANRTDTTNQDRYRAALAGIENLGKLVAIS
jgi:hypothetical protein